MTQLKSIKCDRCGVVFLIPIDERPDNLVYNDGRTIDPRMWGAPIAYTKDLCGDCAAIVNIVVGDMTLDKQIGDLI